MSGDYLERLRAVVIGLEESVARYGAAAITHVATLDLRSARPDALHLADLRAALDELEQLRAEREPRKVVCPVCQRPTKLTATGLIRYHGPHNRPCKGSSILPEVEADSAPQQPERDGGAL